MAVETKKITKFLNKLLNTYEFTDYCPNGLQIEGTDTIKKVAFSVSATRHSIEEAISKNANALVVHHGLFWKFHGARALTGAFAKRVKPLVKNDINLFAYHLPLDAHIEFGNAASIAAQIDLTELTPFGDHKGSPTGVKGKFKTPIKALELKKKLASLLNHEVIHSVPEEKEYLSSMGIITGGANNDWPCALRSRLDAYLTGEISEHDWHEASESGIHYFAGGHHATEQFGIQELMKRLQSEFPKLETFYINSDNPA